MLTEKGRLSMSTIQYKTNLFVSFMQAIIFLLQNPTKIAHHSGIPNPLVHMPNTT
jgi:hypothetical protein